MKFEPLVIALAAAVLGLPSASAQDRATLKLARQLADEGSRETAITQITASPERYAALLISWTLHAPDKVDKQGLYVGLADVFGRLRDKDAIPFLIRNIELRRHVYEVIPWNRSAEAVQESLPAASALIQIGPDASKALMRSYSEPKPAGRRLFEIFVISRIAPR